MTKTDLGWPTTDYCCIPEEVACAADCMCGRDERALRAYVDGKIVVPMTDSQRAFCLNEIGTVEGYDAKEHRGDSDVELARTVLSAWTDYCRDKGLL